MAVGIERGFGVVKAALAPGGHGDLADQDHFGGRGGFVLGHGLDSSVLARAGVSAVDAAVVATDGDNTNVVIGQVLQKRHGLDRVVVRVLDPARARFYAERGLQTVCPTQTAISEMLEAVRTGQLEPAGPS